ncbi:hypothetical protein Fcan01_23627 [Folsomia candida]|uniref:Uncharacterized protein n=1 Tax=Folsomia candida TaxID=158441 RepID=A0A226D9D6_FOLCA|nr:hypothetical protein Fcan01_23627 [Folsomia candida]
MEITNLATYINIFTGCMVNLINYQNIDLPSDISSPIWTTRFREIPLCTGGAQGGERFVMYSCLVLPDKYYGILPSDYYEEYVKRKYDLASRVSQGRPQYHALVKDISSRGSYGRHKSGRRLIGPGTHLFHGKVFMPFRMDAFSEDPLI